MAVHRYIMSFVRAAQAAGYEVSSLRMSGSPDDATVELRWKRSERIAFRAWVETRRNARGTKTQYGYVELVHDARTGRARLLDWTSLDTRAEFRLNANGAGKELTSIFRKLRSK